MPQSLDSILIHIIFSTKNREPCIAPDIRPTLHAYLAGILADLRTPSIETGGTIDHVHTLVSLGRTTTVARLVEEVKKGSSKWMKQHGLESFAWQLGYGAFSIGESQKPAVIRYIKRQEEHHRRHTFQDELRRFLVRYRVAYDERYVWD